MNDLPRDPRPLIPIYDPQRHRRAFEGGLRTFVARRCPSASSRFRDRVTAAVVKRFPASGTMRQQGPEETLRRIVADEGFYQEAGGFWWFMFWILIEAIARAAVEYWFETLKLEGQS